MPRKRLGCLPPSRLNNKRHAEEAMYPDRTYRRGRRQSHFLKKPSLTSLARLGKYLDPFA